jgi:hypothetical protein
MSSYQSRQVSEVYPQHNSQELVNCVLLRNSSGSKLRLVVGSMKVIRKRKTYLKLATH